MVYSAYGSVPTAAGSHFPQSKGRTRASSVGGEQPSLLAPAPSNNVELATLTLPDQTSKKAVILHASKETTDAFTIDSVEIGDASSAAAGSDKARIQAVVDLEKLSHLAHATDKEFVTGLHREANDHTFNPKDSLARMDSILEDEETFQDDRVSILISSSVRSIKRDVPLEILPFADAVMDTEHLDVDDSCVFRHAISHW